MSSVLPATQSSGGAAGVNPASCCVAACRSRFECEFPDHVHRIRAELRALPDRRVRDAVLLMNLHMCSTREFVQSPDGSRATCELTISYVYPPLGRMCRAAYEYVTGLRSSELDELVYHMSQTYSLFPTGISAAATSTAAPAAAVSDADAPSLNAPGAALAQAPSSGAALAHGAPLLPTSATSTTSSTAPPPPPSQPPSGDPSLQPAPPLPTQPPARTLSPLRSPLRSQVSQLNRLPNKVWRDTQRSELVRFSQQLGAGAHLRTNLYDLPLRLGVRCSACLSVCVCACT